MLHKWIPKKKKRVSFLLLLKVNCEKIIKGRKCKSIGLFTKKKKKGKSIGL